MINLIYGVVIINLRSCHNSSPSNALPREDSSVVADAAAGFDVANAVTLGALGVGAVGSLVYALYADRAMRRLANAIHPKL